MKILKLNWICKKTGFWFRSISNYQVLYYFFFIFEKSSTTATNQSIRTNIFIYLAILNAKEKQELSRHTYRNNFVYNLDLFWFTSFLHECWLHYNTRFLFHSYIIHTKLFYFYVMFWHVHALFFLYIFCFLRVTKLILF